MCALPALVVGHEPQLDAIADVSGDMPGEGQPLEWLVLRRLALG